MNFKKTKTKPNQIICWVSTMCSALLRGWEIDHLRLGFCLPIAYSLARKWKMNIWHRTWAADYRMRELGGASLNDSNIIYIFVEPAVTKNSAGEEGWRCEGQGAKLNWTFNGSIQTLWDLVQILYWNNTLCVEVSIACVKNLRMCLCAPCSSAVKWDNNRVDVGWHLVS